MRCTSDAVVAVGGTVYADREVRVAPMTSADSETRSPRRVIPVWLVPLLIGIVTVTAGLFTWRAGQLGSSAAFEDRQSVGQTIKREEQRVEVSLGAVNDAVAYVRYVADFAEAGALDDIAGELQAQQQDSFATTFSDDADTLRRSASELAAASGVFGQQTLLSQVITLSDQPQPFDLDDQIARLEAQATTGIASAGDLDPQRWADQADETRSRVRGLRLATLLLLVSVVAYTIAQLAEQRPIRWAGFAVGSTMFCVVSVTTIATVF